MAAAAARSEQLDSIADNLANAETPGYKAALPAFQSFLPKGAGAAGQLVDKVFSAAVATGTDMSPGAVVTTDNPLDVVPEGGSFMAVNALGGQRAFTRNGQLSVSPEGLLVAAGRPILSDRGTVISLPPGSRVAINETGHVSADGTLVDRIALYALQGNVTRVGPQLYAPGAGGNATPVPPADSRVTTGQLEMGNVTALESTVALINAQRQFESATQAIQTYKRLDDRAMEVGRVR
jgi:flagellar basal-body rod protein FlgF